MSEHDAAIKGQVTGSAAETYEAFFVPALFEQWTDLMLDTAGLADGDAVLDVGCGTGILARHAARRLGDTGSVTGIDCNPGMLAVARQASERVSWQEGAAERLPYPDGAFDRVVSQFALMFFADQRDGVREMARVTRSGGSVTLATWVDVEESPGYAGMVDLLGRLFGDEAAAALSAPFSLGDEATLRGILDDTLPDVTVTRHEGVARFDSLDAWIHTDVRGWTLADMITDQQHDELLAVARIELARFVDDRGAVCFPAPALIASARCP